MRGRLVLGVSCSIFTALGVVAGCVGDDPVTSPPTADGAAPADGSIPTDSSSGDVTTTDGGDAVAPQCDVTPCVVQISAGGAHTCARIADGTVRCWGETSSVSAAAAP